MIGCSRSCCGHVVATCTSWQSGFTSSSCTLPAPVSLLRSDIDSHKRELAASRQEEARLEAQVRAVCVWVFVVGVCVCVGWVGEGRGGRGCRGIM